MLKKGEKKKSVASSQRNNSNSDKNDYSNIHWVPSYAGTLLGTEVTSMNKTDGSALLALRF